MKKTKRFVISILTPDDIGILKKITCCITDLQGNIDGMSQTVVHDYFTVVMTASFSSQFKIDDLMTNLQDNFADEKVSIVIKPYKKLTSLQKGLKVEHYILTLTGKEQAGILKVLTSYLTEKQINIEDYYFKISNDRVNHIGEISVPVNLDIKQIKDELQILLGKMNLSVNLQHENLFKAANEVDSIRLKLKEDKHAK